MKAYRDTWTLGLHSYLTYLRDRLKVAWQLLADSGSVFVQISDENLHRVRGVMDEVFGAHNFVCQVSVQKTGSAVGSFIQTNLDFLLWFAKDKSKAEAKFHPIYANRRSGGAGGSGYTRVEESSGVRRPIRPTDLSEDAELRPNLRLWSAYPLTSEGSRVTTTVDFEFQGRRFHPGANRHWGVVPEELRRAARAGRVVVQENQIRLVRYWEDSPVIPLGVHWGNIGGASELIFAVQTNPKIVERCILMTTDPGDLVLDPTCGSGTTAFVAEQWGRRWITIDTSRVALALARQRILTAHFDHYRTHDGSNRVAPSSFVYKTVSHITLRSIAQNTALDPIFNHWEPVLREKLAVANATLSDVTPETRGTLLAKLEAKRRRRGLNDPVTEADERRWNLPKDRWEEWQLPFDSDPDWPQSLQDALAGYRATWRQKMDEVNACIAAAADPVDLVDQPEVVRGVVRVSGPFTVEAVQPAEELLDGPSEPDDEDLLETFASGGPDMAEPINAGAYLDRMLRLLRQDGIRFPENKENKFARLEPLREGSVLHAEGEWANGDGVERRVAVAFGPQYGPITAKQVEDCLRAAHRRAYDDLVLAGFSFDGAAQAAITADPDPDVRCHMAHINPDVNMGDLLKNTPSSQLFTVFGMPRTKPTATENGEWVMEMQGVDIYDPLSNSVYPSSPNQVAAWFLDSDYDGRTFCITQAFFPDASAWEKLARALKDSIPEEAFAAFSGTVSLPFPAGKHKRAAVKVIDPRGNEVMAVHVLGEMTYDQPGA